MNEHDVHDELERLGRRPVPAPRAEFVETLLARIQLTDDVVATGTVTSLDSRRRRRARAVLAGAAAAAVLAVVGLVALSSGGGNQSPDVEVALQNGASVSAEVSKGGGIEVSAGSLADGTYDATCVAGGQVQFEGGSITCETGDELRLEVVEGTVRDARVVRPEVPPPSPQPPLLLGLEPEPFGDEIQLTWQAYEGGDFASYQVLRTLHDGEGEVGAIAYPPGAGVEVVAEIADARATTLRQPLSDLPVNTPKVAYRVVALNGAGEVVANTLTVDFELDWERSGGR